MAKVAVALHPQHHASFSSILSLCWPPSTTRQHHIHSYLTGELNNSERNRVWHETIKFALDRSSWLTLPLGTGETPALQTWGLINIPCCNSQSATKHIADACRVSVHRGGSLRHVLSVKCRRKFRHSSSWFPLPLQVHHGEMVQLEKLLST